MKRSRQVMVLAILVGLGAILLSACGGGSSDRLSKAEYAAKANALCNDPELNKASDGLGSVSTPAELSAAIDKLLPLTKKMVAGLKKLNPPADEEATAKKAVAASEEAIAGIEEINAVVKSGDMTKAQKLFAKFQGTGNKADALFLELGAKDCAAD